VKGFLSQKGVDYEVRDITVDESAQMELMELGFTAIPVTVIGEEEPILGANYRAIEKALNA
jgi:glutaredoxin